MINTSTHKTDIMSSNTVVKIPQFDFNHRDQKFIDDVIENIKSKHFPSDGKWFLNNFYYFKSGSKLKIDLGRVVKYMSIPDDKSDLSASLSMSSIHLLSQIQYIIEALVIKLPEMLKSVNWYLTELKFMFYDPDFIRTNKYTNVTIKGNSSCNIIAYIQPIKGLTPICKNPDAPKNEMETNVTTVETIVENSDNFITVNKKNTNTKKSSSIKCSTCVNVFTPEKDHYHNCPACFTKIRANNSKPVVTSKNCSDCSAPFKPIQQHYHQCSPCFGKRTK